MAAIRYDSNFLATKVTEENTQVGEILNICGIGSTLNTS